MALSPTTHPWTCPDADAEGFVPYERLSRDAAEMTIDTFVRSYPLPVLRVVSPEVSSGIRNFFSSLDRGVQRWATQRVDDGGFLRYLEKAAFVAKRRHHTDSRVSIGRDESNDIVMTIGTVSKVHGWFVDEPTGWHFTDPGSTNGTWISNVRIPHRRRTRLEDGCILRFGQGTTLQFLLPPSLWEMARQGQTQPGPGQTQLA